MSDRHDKQSWPTASKPNPCPKCQHTDRCLVAPDGKAGKCWRDGGKVWHANNGQARGDGGNGQAGPTGDDRKQAYATAVQAIEAMERWKKGNRVADWTYRDAGGLKAAATAARGLSRPCRPAPIPQCHIEWNGRAPAREARP